MLHEKQMCPCSKWRSVYRYLLTYLHCPPEIVMEIIPFCQHCNLNDILSWLKYSSFPLIFCEHLLSVRQNIKAKRGEPYWGLSCPRQHYDILSASLHHHPVLQGLAALFPGLSPTFIFPENPHSSSYTGWVLDQNCPKGRCAMMEMF